MGDFTMAIPLFALAVGLVLGYGAGFLRGYGRGIRDGEDGDGRR